MTTTRIEISAIKLARRAESALDNPATSYETVRTIALVAIALSVAEIAEKLCKDDG